MKFKKLSLTKDTLLPLNADESANIAAGMPVSNPIPLALVGCTATDATCFSDCRCTTQTQAVSCNGTCNTCNTCVASCNGTCACGTTTTRSVNITCVSDCHCPSQMQLMRCVPN